jgi:hypothetical protein
MGVLEGIAGALLDALSLAFGMTWEILWATPKPSLESSAGTQRKCEQRR